jgi:hypothetical protein
MIIILHINSLCEEKCKVFSVKYGGTYTNHRRLNGHDDLMTDSTESEQFAGDI